MEKNPELHVILEGLDSDYAQFCQDIVKDTCVGTYYHQMKSV